MKVSLQEYKVPHGVTTVGLLVAGGLATAPVLQEVVVDQLFEIRDHIDSLLNGIE